MKRLLALCLALTLSACSLGGNLTADVTEGKIHDLETALADARLKASLAEEQAASAVNEVQNIEQQPLELDLLMTEVQQRSQDEMKNLEHLSARLDALQKLIESNDATRTADTAHLKDQTDALRSSLAEQVAGVDLSVESVFEQVQKLSAEMASMKALATFSAEMGAHARFAVLQQDARGRIDTMFGIGGCAALPLTWNGATRGVADFIAKTRQLGLAAAADEMNASMKQMVDELNRECRFDALKWQS